VLFQFEAEKLDASLNRPAGFYEKAGKSRQTSKLEALSGIYQGLRDFCHRKRQDP
jgi:hypothetical protein